MTLAGEELIPTRCIVRASVNAATDHLRRFGMAGPAKAVGHRAPDFALTGRDGGPVVLSDLLSRGPVVLSFFRGEWCSFCRLEMDALFDAAPRIAERGASLAFVSAQAPSPALAARLQGRPDLTVLHDPMNGVALQYGLVFRVPDRLRHALLSAGVDLAAVYGTDAWLLPIPATYLVRPDGTIALAHVEPDFSIRLDPEDILVCL